MKIVIATPAQVRAAQSYFVVPEDPVLLLRPSAQRNALIIPLSQE